MTPRRSGLCGGLAALREHALVHAQEGVPVDGLVGQEVRVADRFDLDPAQHLADDRLNVLVVDVHALVAVDGLDLLREVAQRRFRSKDAEDVVGVFHAAGERLPCLHLVAGANEALRGGVDGVVAQFGFVGVDLDHTVRDADGA